MILRKLFCLLFLLICFMQTPIAQNEMVTTTGEAQVDWTSDKSEIQVKKEAELEATINAIERAFGRIVIQGYSTFLQNLTTGKLVETTTVFNTIAGSNVKGEVVGQPLDIRFEEIEWIGTDAGKKRKFRDIKCTVKINAKPITELTPDFTALTLDCPDPKCEQSEYTENDPFFLYFQSPSPGYLSVFMDDGKICQQLLPYRRMPVSFHDGIPITAGKEYIFFSRKTEFAVVEFRDYVEEYSLRTESPIDQLRIFVVFSATPLQNPVMAEGNPDRLLRYSEQSQGYKLPREISSENFQRWLIYSQTRKQDLRVMRMDITIKR